MKLRPVSVLFIILLFIVASCVSRHAVVALMDSAELVMNESPEQAYGLMSDIDPHSISGRAIQARYALLYTEAQYKNYINETSDSLIMIAVRYYSNHNNTFYRFLSYYYLGCIYSNSKQYVDAILALTQAERLANEIPDCYYTGLLYSQIGNVFFDSFDYQRAKDHFSNAKHSYDSANKVLHKIHAMVDIGRCDLELQEYDSAIAVFKEIKVWADANDDDYLSLLSWQNLSMCLLMDTDKVYTTNDIQSLLLQINDTDNNDPYTLRLLARYFLKTKDYVQSQSYVQSVLSQAHTVSDTIDVLFLKSQIYKELGNQDSAFYYYQQSIACQNSTLKQLLRQPVLGVQKDYYQTISEVESLKADKQKTELIIIFLLLLIVITASALGYTIIKRRNDKRNRDYLLVIDELSAKDSMNVVEIENLNSMISKLSNINDCQNTEIIRQNNRVHDLFLQQFAPTNYVLTRYYDHISDSRVADRLYKIVKEQMDIIISPKNIVKLDSQLNEIYNDIMSRISVPSVHLSEKDIMTIRLLLAGLSVKSIGTLLDCSIHSIYKTKDRTMAKLKKESYSLYEELAKLLEISSL